MFITIQQRIWFSIGGNAPIVKHDDPIEQIDKRRRGEHPEYRERVLPVR